MSKHRLLREIAKVAVGFVIADIVCALWFSAYGFFPLVLLGVTWTTSALWPIVVFDLGLLVLLAHYAWHMRLPIESPSEHNLLIFLSAVFAAIGFVHLVRIAFNLPFVINGLVLPVSFSWVGALVAGYLSYASFHFARHKR